MSLFSKLAPVAAVVGLLVGVLFVPVSTQEATVLFGLASGVATPIAVDASGNVKSTLSTGVVAAANGGTGQSSYTIGDLLYASATTTLSKLTAPAAGQVLVSAGVATAPAWSNSPSLLAVNIGATTATSALANVLMTKVATGLADAAATAVLTITVPNTTQAALISVEAVGSLGAGGAVGAFEASCGGHFLVVVTRVAGVAAVLSGAALDTSTGSATSAGAATCTFARAFSAFSGGAGASNTATINITITRGSGSSTNHQVVMFVRTMNSNASGVTVS